MASSGVRNSYPNGYYFPGKYGTSLAFAFTFHL
jgi:hypothetical protein